MSKNELDIVSNGNVDLTERFVRGERSRTTEGSGLGLSIVKGILSLHNANYGVNSKEGEGSEFWFEMDVVKK